MSFHAAAATREPAAGAKRLAHLHALPGGGRRYKDTLDALVRWIGDAKPDVGTVRDRLRVRWDARRADDAIRLMRALDLVAQGDHGLILTPAGHAYLGAPRSEPLFERLHAAYVGVLEALVVADTERVAWSAASARSLLERLIGRRWKAPAEAASRRNWLLSLGLADRTPEGDAATPLGRRVLASHAGEVAEIRRQIEDLLDEDRAADLARAEAFELDRDEDEDAVEGEDALRPTPMIAPVAFRSDRVDLTAARIRPHLGGLDFPDALLDRVAAALSSGKHLLLVGPPGTGKTELAAALAESARAAAHCEGLSTVTASADWTTFDTVGGYALRKDGALGFRPGVFLSAIERGLWLLVDELNRADVDRAFGELLTVLAGRDVETPFALDDGRLVSIGRSAHCTHRVPPSFRLLATMNTWDRASLFRLSHALTRRFAVVDVGVPADDRYARLILERATEPGADPALDAASIAALRALFSSSGVLAHRAVGPAVALDVIGYLRRRADPAGLAEAIAIHVLPQLDGLDPSAAAAARDSVMDAIRPVSPPSSMAELDARFRDLHP